MLVIVCVCTEVLSSKGDLNSSIEFRLSNGISSRSIGVTSMTFMDVACFLLCCNLYFRSNWSGVCSC